MTIPNGLPILSRGSHDRASGKACIMNAISYLNGDIEITDAPDCVAEPLRHMFISVNDRICYNDPIISVELCPQCSHLMWMYGARVIGSAEAYNRLSIGTQREMAVDMSRVLIKRFWSGETATRQLDYVDVMVERGIMASDMFSDTFDKVTRHLLDAQPVDPTGDLRRNLARQMLDTTLDVFNHYTHQDTPVDDPTEEQFQKVVDEAKVAVYAA